jgi:serine phosphatase RsbU (regulator of sigma subunit)
MKKWLFSFVFFWGLAYSTVEAQDRKLVDSLKKIDRQSIHDSTRTLVYYQISRAYRHNKYDSSFWYANKGLEIARKVDFKKGIAANINGLSTLELNQGNYLVALKFALEALSINEKLNDIHEIANTKNNIGEVYRLLRNHQKALQYYNEALILNRKIKYNLGVAINLNNIGEIYTAQGKYEAALEHLLQSLAICKELKDKRRIGLRYNNIGEVYEKQNKDGQARQYFEESLVLNTEIGNRLYQSVALCNLAKLALKAGKLDIEKAEKAFEIARSIKAKREITNALGVIVSIYEAQKRYELAFQHYKLLNQYKDSINIEEVDKQTKQIQYDYELNKKEKEILVLEHDKKLRAHQDDSQFAYNIVFGIIVLLLVVLALLQYRRNIAEKRNQKLLHDKNKELISQKDLIDEQKEDLEKAYQRMLRNERKLEKMIEQSRENEASIEKQRKELEIQHDKISSSIKSAYVIQQAILPYQEKMTELLHHYFILYKPKDIVSGDFWWLNNIDSKIFLATIDCTGHGVAGAFMTMIGNTLLDKIVRLRNIHNPAEILEVLHEEIQIVLRQKENKNNNGMDMSIVCLEHTSPTETRLTFAGAKHSIYYIEAGKENEIFELKGTRKAIGGQQNEETHFENKIITLSKGSWVYTGSDGLPDQNNTKRKRFGEQRIKEILIAQHTQPAPIQKEALEQALEAHMSETEQRDDILWIGFEI